MHSLGSYSMSKYICIFFSWAIIWFPLLTEILFLLLFTIPQWWTCAVVYRWICEGVRVDRIQKHYVGIVKHILFLHWLSYRLKAGHTGSWANEIQSHVFTKRLAHTVTCRWAVWWTHVAGKLSANNSSECFIERCLAKGSGFHSNLGRWPDEPSVQVPSASRK